MLDNRVFTTQEAADYLKINPQVLKKYLRQGKVPAKKVGRQWRMSKLALDLWLAPELAMTLPRLSAWQEVFSLGDEIGKKVKLSDKKILTSLKSLRKQRGLSPQSRS